jgi:hypothetical protein
MVAEVGIKGRGKYTFNIKFGLVTRIVPAEHLSKK